MKKVEIFKVPKTLPKKLAQCADLLYLARQERLEVQKRVDAIQELEVRLKDRIIAELPKSEASGISGRVARAQFDRKSVPQVSEEAGGWPAFYAFVAREKAFDLLQRRLNEAAVKERWENKKRVPGVTAFHVVTVSCTKLGGKK